MTRSRTARWPGWWVACGGGAVAAAVAVGVGLGMTLARPSPAAAQAARTFDAPAGMMLNYVRRGSTTDFEAVLTRLGAVLSESEDDEHRAQLAGWKIYKAREAGPNEDVLYVWVLDPAVTGADYSVSQILSEEVPAEVQELYESFNEAFGTGQVLVNLDLVEFGSRGRPAGRVAPE